MRIVIRYLRIVYAVFYLRNYSILTEHVGEIGKQELNLKTKHGMHDDIHVKWII